MSQSTEQQHLDFNFEGQFLGFAGHAGKLKYLRLRVLSEEMQIKIPKDLRLSVDRSMQPGALILVTGMGKFDPHAHVLKLKAAQITPLLDRLDPIIPEAYANSEFPTAHQPKIKPKIKVLVCQKSGCLKKGGKGLGETLHKTLCDRNLDQHVTIQPTGCLKCCSSAPNLVVMPGNRRYTNVRPKTVVQIVDEIAQRFAVP